MRKKRILSIFLIASLLLSGCNATKQVDKSSNKGIKQEESKDTINIGEIKGKYGVVEDKTMKPFYNVEQNTQFTFHFNSNVEPVYAVTVHTDKKCEESSIVYQINDGYITDKGVDVVVKPGSPILNTSDREGGSLENYNWGNAPIYYLCIRYDMDAKTPTLLDEPIIVPFTVKNKVSTPNLSCKISKDGSFSLEWQPIENAVSYKIYESINNSG